MRYKALSSTLFIDNRQRLATALPAKSVAIIQSNPSFPANADAHLPYEPSSYILWLTGIQQAHTAVVMFPDAPREEWKEMLFIEKSTHSRPFGKGNAFKRRCSCGDRDSKRTFYRGFGFSCPSIILSRRKFSSVINESMIEVMRPN